MLLAHVTRPHGCSESERRYFLISRAVISKRNCPSFCMHALLSCICTTLECAVWLGCCCNLTMRGLQNVAARAGRVAGRRANAAAPTAAPATPFHSSSRNNARVLATDGVDDSCIKIFEERGHKVDLLETMSEADLCKVIGEYDGLVVRSATKVTPEVIKHAKKMRVIGRAGVGYDNINVKEATQYVTLRSLPNSGSARLLLSCLLLLVFSAFILHNNTTRHPTQHNTSTPTTGRASW